MITPKPRLAMVSIGIRRDLLAPLDYFSRFEVVHFFRKNVYDDLTAEDLSSSLRQYHSPIDLYQRLVESEPTIIQGVEPFSFYTQPFVWSCVLAARKTRAALVIPTFENRPLNVKFGRLRASVLRRALKNYFDRACLIFALNNGARENAIQCDTPPSKIVRALWGVWGVDTREFFPRSTRDNDQSPTILFAGRLHKEKGVFVLLDAFAQLYQVFPTARLRMVGDGPARDELAAQIQARDLTEVVRLSGIIKHRDMPNVFQNADIFCAPSLTTRKWAEQVGASSLQAMASGLPIVSTRSGAISEYIPDGVAGILVPENDSHALATSLLALLRNPQRAREMGAAGRAYACAHYDARQNVERGEQLLTEYCLARRV